ncbi:MAG TPA: SAM-dependent methyltransferase, partial [Candidatus Dormibacteraeota bacterium]|nr:SAM-dependent methyltransferase [Candidatus Dormibacteraeota bacterium]
SLRQVIPAIQRLLAPHAELLVLLKPQFELGRGRVAKGGIVRSQADREEALQGFTAWAQAEGLQVVASVASRVVGAKGNQEYFVHMRANG